MIYVVSHKPFQMPVHDRFYMPIFVGSNSDKLAEQFNGVSDSTGKQEISHKNPRYCELTALYWMWKNDANNDYIGLNHYRRYFLSQTNGGGILTSNECEEYLKDYDIVTTNVIEFKTTVEKFVLKSAVYVKDMNHLKDSVKHLYPDYYDVLIDFLNGNRQCFANMFVTTPDVFRSYCKWLFDILEDLEKSEDMTGYTIQEKRLYGYLGELLLNVYIKKNKLKAKRLDIVNTELEGMSSAAKKKTQYIYRLRQFIKSIVYFPSGIPFRRRKI